MKLPNHYSHLHRNQHKESIENAIDNLVSRLVENSNDRPNNELEIINEFIEKLLTFKGKLIWLYDNFKLISHDPANSINHINQSIYHQKDKHKVIGIIRQGIINFKNITESTHTCKVSNPKFDSVKNISDIDNKLDRDFYEFLINENLSWGEGVVKYIKHT